MKHKDLLIISHLRKNARETLTNMSKKTHIPISTIYERIKNNKYGIIKKFTSLIDFNKLGYATRANIMLKVGKGCRDEIKDYLMKHASVNSLYKINNGMDFLVEGVFKHLKELEDFLDVLDEKYEVLDTKVHYIIDDLKRETFMSDSQLMQFVNGKV